MREAPLPDVRLGSSRIVALREQAAARIVAQCTPPCVQLCCSASCAFFRQVRLRAARNLTFFEPGRGDEDTDPATHG
jgi:hypothetical protein